jgi:hypothetical protein
LLLLLFGASGFAGLIYESIWSRYLGLILGHAAWAQTLVLAIFMGGMAVGAWWTGRLGERLVRPLLAYAAVEATIGLAGIGFHQAFTSVLELLHERWLPALGGTPAAPAVSWAVAAALILPQSILLGATFPLMTAVLLRRDPARHGRALGLVYFANSAGAAAGVLASGFWLVPALGLPGTITVAGLVNLGLALAAWSCARDPAVAPEEGSAVREAAPAAAEAGWLAAAFVTGLASFFYEIGWIRLLGLVLGTTTQSFELMLSTFILGLALGGWWIRRRLDRVEDPVGLGGRIQLLMGAFALATLPLYALSFDAMALLLRSLERTDRGWLLFQLGSHAIAAAVMLPATIMAGMTLPLFTFVLLRRGRGERAVGRAYAANTAGSIAGVLIAVHLVLPAVGAKGLVVAGAVADVGLGLALIASCPRGLRSRELRLAPAFVALLAVAVTAGVRFDPRRLASGVYRHGESSLPVESEVLFHRDGKTATIAVVRAADGTLGITTNGKSDAQVGPPGAPAADEITQVLLGALPLALHERPSRVAVIGLGSGMTSAVLLGGDVERLATIEIERQVVEAAKLFGPRLARVWSDPRSRIHVEDAKSFFSRRDERWDVIVSEPSNPWVSGVAGLFSEEFYLHVSRYLADGGLFVQWVQLYETDLDLVGSVFRALDGAFGDWAVFHTDNANLVIVARRAGPIGAVGPRLFQSGPVRDELARVGIAGPADLELRRLGGRALLAPVFETTALSANSDYFPVLAHGAPRARFLGSDAIDLTRLHVAPVPLLEMLGGVRRRDLGRTAAITGFTPSSMRQRATEMIAGARPFGAPSRCPATTDEAALLDDWMRLAVAAAPYASEADLERLWQATASHPCVETLSPWAHEWLALHASVARRDGRAMARVAATLLDSAPQRLEAGEIEYLVAAGMTGALAERDPADARRFASRLTVLYPPRAPRPFYLRLLLAHAGHSVPVTE